MAWHKFWKILEGYLDRLLTVTVTLTILKSGGYVQIGWSLIVALWVLLFIGGIVSVLLTSLYALERDAET